MNENCKSDDNSEARILRGGATNEECRATGWFAARCIGPDGKVKWEDIAPNVVCTEGKNHMLDNDLQTSVAIVGPFMGLISSVSYTAVAAADTAAGINGANGWKEAGSSTNYPLYTTPRKTCAWSAASAGAKALSAALSFAIITTGGTVKGCFIIYGASAVSTIADTNGKLWSAGVFTGGDKVVSVGDTLQVSYTTSL